MVQANRIKLFRSVVILCTLCVLCGDSRAQDFEAVHDGVEYSHVIHKIGSDPVKINLLRLDLRKVRLDVVHATDSAIGTEKTSSIAARHGAAAAINAGFFRLDKSIFAGEAAGILMVNGELLSESLNDRATLIVSNANKKSTLVSFGHYKASAFVDFGKEVRHSFVELSGINRERKADEAVVYNPKLAPDIIEGKGDIELRLAECSLLPFSNSDAKRRCRVVEIMTGEAAATIKNPDFIVFFGSDYAAKNGIVEKLRKFQTSGDKTITIRTRVNNGNAFQFISEAVDITNGVGQLIKNGRIDVTWALEKASRAFAESRHPRTAVAKLKDGKFLMMTVDGRQPGVSVGMSLQELAEYLFSLGAVDAMNLDGGGSTTMFLDGKVVNTPSDKEGERKIGDAILVTLRKRGK